MCLAVIAQKSHADWPLIIVANRDEYHDRPTLTADIWERTPHVLAGRDLKAGGTWLGISSDGRIGLLTNYREPENNNPLAPSRGAMVGDYLCGTLTSHAYTRSISDYSKKLNGFNLVLSDPTDCLYFSNRTPLASQSIDSGVFGLSNATLQVPWPKVVRTRESVAKHLLTQSEPDAETLFSIFRDENRAADFELPQTGLSLARERMLSSPFILNEEYGTRCTTLIMVNRNGYALFYERSFNTKGIIFSDTKWQINRIKKIIKRID